jgi:hypothetical protein
MFKAYIAGLLDGDGCIRIGYAEYKPTQNRTYYLSVQITNNYLPVLEQIQGIYKGSIHRQRRAKETHTDTFMWKIGSKRAGKFLRDIYPFFIIKKEQAALALEFQKHIEKWKKKRTVNQKGKKGANGCVPVPESEMKWRDKIYLQLSKLKNPQVYNLRKPYRKTRLIRRKEDLPTSS